MPARTTRDNRAVADVTASSARPSARVQSAPLALYARRAAGALVGRPAEVAAIEQELQVARSGRFAAVTAEGEPGIGKTRLLYTTVELAEDQGYAVIAVTADEELRAPFLVARAIFGSPSARQAVAGRSESEALERALDAINGRFEAGLEALPREEQLLRTHDLAALAMQALAQVRPLAILVDDAQWADEDSLRMLRYVLRTSASSPIFLMLAIRPEETALLREAVTLIADMERIGLVRRLVLTRFSQAETGQFARQLLGADVEPTTMAMIHAQSEGVPFIAEELIRAYRDASMLQQLDGVWTAARNADRLVPSAVRTLIDRRASRLDEPTRVTLAEAAILGRRFSLRDLSALRGRLGEADDPTTLAELLGPAVTVGLLTAYPDDPVADYSFPHEQVREQAAAALSQARRRMVHEAIVEMLTSGGDPPSGSLAIIAHHARAAGNTELAGRYSIDAARASLASNAPEEAVRMAKLGLASVSTPQDRAELLRVQDEALAVLRRPEERLRGLAELEALADALRDPSLGLEAMLRRSATFRMLEDLERAADLARQVRTRAAAAGDPRMELAAVLELGQALLGSSLGESFVPVQAEIDSEGAREAFERATVLAVELGDDASLAAATRELGVITMARVRSAVMGLMDSGQVPEDIGAYEPIAVPLTEARQRFEAALELYERLGDRRGVMLAIISLAYSTWGAEGVMGSARHLEAIRRLNNLLETLTTESERAASEAQLLYAIHVYAAANGFPDLALTRGAQAAQAAGDLGDRGLEFMAAIGMASVHLQIGETAEASRWLDRASVAAAAEPTPLRARQLEVGRGILSARQGDAEAAIQHLERAVGIATEQGRMPARCEALARLALEAARLGSLRQDERLLALAERCAAEVRHAAASLSGHPPWLSQAQAAMAEVNVARGDVDAARAAARDVAESVQWQDVRELFDDIVRPVARVLAASADGQDRQTARALAQRVVGLVAERTADEDIAQRWFRVPEHAELVELAGGIEAARGAVRATPESLVQQRLPKLPLDLSAEETSLVRLMMEGRTDGEIAATLSLDAVEVASRLRQIFAKMGAPSRSVATLYAFMADII